MMKTWKLELISAAVMAGCGGGQQVASVPTSTLSATDGNPCGEANLSPVDSEFITQAASGALFEVKLSETALARGEFGDMKVVAQRIIEDSSTANRELEQLVLDREIDLPTELLPEHERMVQQLVAEPDATSVPARYRELQIAAHTKMLALFEGCAKECEDAALLLFATRTLPTLRVHLQMLEQFASANTAQR